MRSLFARASTRCGQVLLLAMFGCAPATDYANTERMFNEQEVVPVEQLEPIYIIDKNGNKRILFIKKISFQQEDE